MTHDAPAPLSVKGVCLDAGGRVHVCRNRRREWELRGGRPEIGQELPDCLRRERVSGRLTRCRPFVAGAARVVTRLSSGAAEARLYSLDAGRESTLYTDGEPAALAVCESMTGHFRLT